MYYTLQTPSRKRLRSTETDFVLGTYVADLSKKTEQPLPISKKLKTKHLPTNVTKSGAKGNETIECLYNIISNMSFTEPLLMIELPNLKNLPLPVDQTAVDNAHNNHFKSFCMKPKWIECICMRLKNVDGSCASNYEIRILPVWCVYVIPKMKYAGDENGGGIQQSCVRCYVMNVRISICSDDELCQSTKLKPLEATVCITKLVDKLKEMLFDLNPFYGMTFRTQTVQDAIVRFYKPDNLPASLKVYTPSAAKKTVPFSEYLLKCKVKHTSVPKQDPPFR